MQLTAYARYAYGVGEDLRSMLHDEAYEDLLSQLSAQSQLDLIAFVRREYDLVEKIATAQPAQRMKSLSKLPLDQRFWAIAAAAQMAFEAAAVLDVAEVELRPGGPYRSMIGAVQNVLAVPFVSEDCVWPFPTVPPKGVLD